MELSLLFSRFPDKLVEDFGQLTKGMCMNTRGLCM